MQGIAPFRGQSEAQELDLLTTKQTGKSSLQPAVQVHKCMYQCYGKRLVVVDYTVSGRRVRHQTAVSPGCCVSLVSDRRSKIK